MFEEEWRPIPGVPGYQASSWGRIYSEQSDRILRGSISGNGYRYVKITQAKIRGGKRDIAVHVLVCHTFSRPKRRGYEVRHLDNDRLNNVATNLRWGTRSTNAQDAVRHGTHYFSRRSK